MDKYEQCEFHTHGKIVLEKKLVINFHFHSIPIILATLTHRQIENNSIFLCAALSTFSFLLRV